MAEPAAAPERPAGRRPPCILNIEDDEDIARIIRTLLERAGFRVVSVADGREGLRRFHDERPDLVILDVGLPTLDGWTLIERVRDLSTAPILVLTARDSEHDKVRGLRAGADDYLTKPFGNSELVARVEALLRRHAANIRVSHRDAAAGGTGAPAGSADAASRSGGAPPPAPAPPPPGGLHGGNPAPGGAGPGGAAPGGSGPGGAGPGGAGPGGAGPGGSGPPGTRVGAGRLPSRGTLLNEHGVEVDFELHIVRAGGKPVDLTPTEFRLLETLMGHRGQVLSPEQLLQLAWRDPTATGPDRVKFTVLRLRRKLGWDSGPNNPIETLRGFGYRYRPEVRQ